MTSEELSEINASIAHAVVTNKLDANPVMQGLLVKCLQKLDRESRGIYSNRGRAPRQSEGQQALIQDAALTLAIQGGSRQLCRTLGQNVTQPSVHPEDLVGFSLPNPCLALAYPEQLKQNMELIDLRYPRTPSAAVQRCVCAFDATYLMKAMSQMKVRGVAGLVGSCWSPQTGDAGFIPLDNIPETIPHAPVVMEFLCWDPSAISRAPLSAAEMPMALAAPKNETQSSTHTGNVDTRCWDRISLVCHDVF